MAEDMRARVLVTLKSGVLDPAGTAVESSLHSLGFSLARNVRLGKLIELDVDESDPQKATALVTQMAQKLFANVVVENFKVELLS
jgi:phosphoribosylformylglycinamidine synthase subunit PurS